MTNEYKEWDVAGPNNQPKNNKVMWSCDETMALDNDLATSKVILKGLAYIQMGRFRSLPIFDLNQPQKDSTICLQSLDTEMKAFATSESTKVVFQF